MAAGSVAGLFSPSLMEAGVEDQGLGMEETGHGLPLLAGDGPGAGAAAMMHSESYHSESLLSTDFMTDGRSSTASGLDVMDRLTYLEQRMHMQEEEIQMLKMALTDVLKRLNISEEHHHQASRKVPTGKSRPASLALSARPPMSSTSAGSQKKSNTMPSAVTGRNYIVSPTAPKSAVKNSAGSGKDSPKTVKSASRPSSAASTTKKPPESSSKAKEPAVNVGSRRVTQCKVTMQIYLSPLTRRTGSSETIAAGPAVPAGHGPVSAPTAPQAKAGVRLLTRKSAPTFTLNLQKTTTSSQSTPVDTASYKSPLKSPSQYFQICY